MRFGDSRLKPEFVLPLTLSLYDAFCRILCVPVHGTVVRYLQDSVFPFLCED